MENSLEKGEVIISHASPEDARDIQHLLYTTWVATYPNKELGITVEDVEEQNKIRLTEERIKLAAERIKNLPDTELYLVAKTDGKVIGVCRFVKHPDKNQLQTLYVLPEFQGKGIGTRLWEEGKVFFDTTKDTSVHVATYNTNAINFYKKLGFLETGKEFTNEQFKLPSGTMIPEMEMVIKANYS